MIRRSILSGLVIGGVIAMTPNDAFAQADYPTRAIRFIVPSGPGSAPDLIPRLIGEKLTATWGQPVIVEHRPGAGGNLGAEFVFRSAPDGYTLLSTWASPLAINQSLYARINFDPAAFVPISVIATSPNVLVVHRDIPAASLAELVARAKANPDKFTYASVGIGGTPHLAMEMLNAAAGISIRRIPYNRGLAPAITDTVAGQVDMVFGNLADVRTHIASGAVKALAVGSERRIPELPGIPAVAETYPGFLNVAWYAFVAPPRTPEEIAARLSAKIAETLQQPEVAQRMREIGLTPVGTTPGEAAAFIKSETERWRVVIEKAGIRAD